MEVSKFSPVIMSAEAQSLSNSLQEGIRFVHPLCPTFPDASRLRFYPDVFTGRERRASTFRINNASVGLGSSCLPAEQHPCKHCVKHA